MERLTQAGAAVEDFRCLEAFTIFAAPFRYDVDPEPMGLDRAHWLLCAEQLVDHVVSLIGSEASRLRLIPAVAFPRVRLRRAAEGTIP